MKKMLSFWKGVGMMFKILGLLVVVALLAPIGYLAWRAGQPMSMPEYGGRTYYDLLAERRQGYADLAAEYQAGHPNADVKVGMCFQVEVAVSLGNTLPWAGLCMASELIPGIKIHGSRSQEIGCGQMGGTWLNFLSTWWQTFESLLYKDILETASHGPVPYCRSPAP